MLVINKVQELEKIQKRLHEEGKSIGLVPTMGALHSGHYSLLERARQENDIVVCSIFVNPVQFNNAEDLEKYPRTLEQDLAYIEKVTDIVFAPTVDEVFPTPPTEKYNFGALETVMEGAFRPGHFNGVGVIVKRLFDWTQPHRVYFGEKDFQQLAIIQELVRQYAINIEIVPCPIVREASGLALSSRNARLSEADRTTAANIHRILESSRNCSTLQETQQFVEEEMAKVPEFTLDYFAIANARTLQPIENFSDAETVIGCIAVFIGGVRLIDNVKYK